MIITEKMIRELQRRVDVSYEEAERFLKRAGGNIDIAESYAMRKENSIWSRLFSELENIIDATLVYRLKIYKDEDVYTNIPVIVLVVLLALIGVDKSLFVGVVFVVWALLADCNLKLDKVERDTSFTFNKGSEKRTRQRVTQAANRTERVQRNAEKKAYKKVRKARQSTRKAGISVNIDFNHDQPSENDQVHESGNQEPVFDDEYNSSQDQVEEIVEPSDSQEATGKVEPQYQEGEYLPTDDDDDDYYEVTIEK